MQTETAETVFVHPQALCESDHVGPGTRIWAFAHVMHGAQVGRSCNIGDHAFVESGATIGDRVTIKNGVMVWNGVTIEDDAFIGPGVLFTNDRHPRSPRMPEVAARYAHSENWLIPTLVQHGASIGAGAVILCGVTIGRFAVIGAGAVVTHDVTDHRVAVGNPARLVGWACRCGVPLKGKWACGQCRRRYRLDKDSLIALE
jgi:acetyltransferase-like isoleucine patch superfamily enzyme